MKNFLCLFFLVSVMDGSLLAQTNFLAPGDNLVVEGIPGIPTALTDEIGRYTEFRSAGLSSWHPKQREMVIITRFADTRQVHLVKFPGGARTQLTFFKDSVGGATYQPTRGNYLVFSKDSGGDENYQIYRYDFETGAITLLTDGKSRNTGGIWSDSGNKFVYGSTRRNGQDVDLWMINPSEPKSDRLLAQLQGGGWGALDVSPDERKLLVTEEISANESYLWLIDIATGDRTPLTPKNETGKVFYGSAQFSEDNQGIYATTDRDSEFQRLAYIDLATKKH